MPGPHCGSRPVRLAPSLPLAPHSPGSPQLPDQLLVPGFLAHGLLWGTETLPALGRGAGRQLGPAVRSTACEVLAEGAEGAGHHSPRAASCSLSKVPLLGGAQP